MMKKVLCACLLCLFITGGVSFGSGYKIRKSLVAGQTGAEVLAVSVTACSPDLVCDGVIIDNIITGSMIGVCWDAANGDRCEAGPITVTAVGTHYFTVVAYEDDRDVTYQRWDETTQSYVDTTYTMPGSESAPSNECVLVVRPITDIPVPPSGGSCSLRRLLP